MTDSPKDSIALLIDAMDILYTKDIQTFCLVSSDSDFTPSSSGYARTGRR